MSRFINAKLQCAVCGEESTHSLMLSTNRCGSSDLDFRPPEMMRSTMRWWIQECPRCGYVSDRLDNKCGVTQEWLKTSDFISQKRSFNSRLAGRFYKYYWINTVINNIEDAFYAALHAAWACDDANDLENAIHCRMLALAELNKMIDSPYSIENHLVIKADLLRRTMQFDTLIKEYTGKQFSTKILNQIIAFQIEKANEKDVCCYRIEDVTAL